MSENEVKTRAEWYVWQEIRDRFDTYRSAEGALTPFGIEEKSLLDELGFPSTPESLNGFLLDSVWKLLVETRMKLAAAPRIICQSCTQDVSGEEFSGHRTLLCHKPGCIEVYHARMKARLIEELGVDMATAFAETEPSEYAWNAQEKLALSVLSERLNKLRELTI